MENLNSIKNLKERIVSSNNEEINSIQNFDTQESSAGQLNKLNFDIAKEEKTIKNTTEEVNRVRRELGLDGEEENIPSIDTNKNKEIKLKEVLNKFTKIAAVGTGLLVGSNNVEANNQNNNILDNFGQKIENVSNIDEEKTIKRANIGEVVVYGKKKYQEELTKQQENIKKFEAEMAKYQKDSIEWVVANKAYQDSLEHYNFAKPVYDKGYYDVDAYNKASDYYHKKYGSYGKFWIDKNNYPKIKSLNMKKIDGKIIDEGRPTWGVPVFTKPKNEPIPPQRPENPLNKEIKYDPKFEHLNMRSLWATILKQDPNAKIGTLKVLDPEFKEGFTLDEAINFPQEIKDQYNIDYIYNQIHKLENEKKEDYKHPGWNYNDPQK